MTEIQDILDVSQVLASGKRLLLLFILKNEPKGYTNILKNFKEYGIPIGSSEIYKHLKTLMDGQYIVKSGKNYILTLKGFNVVNSVSDIIETPPTIPRISMHFKTNNK
ncbi:MAG: hypothetical protein J7J93_01985 [Candidatus Aenigmarchaeota archaeon]|nr:hypothetical protein [Candidatus Aenigmarchaeota archaeon]